MAMMKFCWSFVVFLCGIHITFALSEKFFKPFEIPKLGILDAITNPKLPKLPGFQVNKQIGFGMNQGGGFGFGFGFGGQFGGSSGTGVNTAPKEKQPEKPHVSWEEEEKRKVGPRPNWSEEEKVPKPDSYDEIKKDTAPDWEDIGEVKKDPKSEDMMDGDLVADGLIQPRRNNMRPKRFIESKIYHVPLLFRSNAKPYQVKIRSKPNSLAEEK